MPIKMPPPHPVYFNTIQTAELIGVERKTLTKWRHNQIGPPFRKTGDGTIRYHKLNILEWMVKTDRFLPDGRPAEELLREIQQEQRQLAAEMDAAYNAAKEAAE